MSSRSAVRALLGKTSFVRVATMLSAEAGTAQNSDVRRRVVPPGIKEVQVAFVSLKPEAIFKIGENADGWVQVTDDAVWVTSSKPASVHRIDPKSNKEVAVVSKPGEPGAGLAAGLGSLWVPLCGKPNSMARVDSATNRISAILPIGPSGEEGRNRGRDSVWNVIDDAGNLVRIDPATN